MKTQVTKNEMVYSLSKEPAIPVGIYLTDPATNIKYDLDFLYKEINSDEFNYYVLYKNSAKIMNEIVILNGWQNDLDLLQKAQSFLNEMIGNYLGTLHEEVKTFILMCR